MDAIRKAIVIHDTNPIKLNDEINAKIHEFTANGYICINVSAPSAIITNRGVMSVYVTLSFATPGASKGERDANKFNRSVPFLSKTEITE